MRPKLIVLTLALIAIFSLSTSARADWQQVAKSICQTVAQTAKKIRGGTATRQTATVGGTCVIYLYGGSFVRKDLGQIEPYRDVFAGADLVVLDYGTLPAASISRQIANAANVAKEQAKTHSEVYLVGYSSGALVAVMAARKTRVDGVVGIAAPLDLSTVPELSGLSRLLPGVDPIRDAASATTPTLLIHGTDDTRCLIDGARRYAATAKNCTLIEVDGEGHALALIRSAGWWIREFLGLK